MIEFTSWIKRCGDMIKTHGSCMAIGDDIRPMPSLADACSRYADLLSRPVASLTDDERRVAFLNAVFESYDPGEN